MSVLIHFKGVLESGPQGIGVRSLSIIAMVAVEVLMSRSRFGNSEYDCGIEAIVRRDSY